MPYSLQHHRRRADAVLLRHRLCVITKLSYQLQPNPLSLVLQTWMDILVAEGARNATGLGPDHILIS